MDDVYYRDYIYLPALRGIDKQGYLGLYKALGVCLKKQRLSAAAWWERLIKDNVLTKQDFFLLFQSINKDHYAILYRLLWKQTAYIIY